ncbi:hypothetical protein EDB19DRAFT_1198603 [Suillus lakei]|nr:hypothetical protein EDB19DRAFT_1198603 [Suillus lakei]
MRVPERSTLRNEGKPPVFAYIKFDADLPCRLINGIQKGLYNCGIAAVEMSLIRCPGCRCGRTSANASKSQVPNPAPGEQVTWRSDTSSGNFQNILNDNPPGSSFRHPDVLGQTCDSASSRTVHRGKVILLPSRASHLQMSINQRFRLGTCRTKIGLSKARGFGVYGPQRHQALIIQGCSRFFDADRRYRNPVNLLKHQGFKHWY